MERTPGSDADESAFQVLVNRDCADRIRFHVSDIATLHLPAASVDAAMSVDMLVFVPDIDAVMAEVARVLRPGPRFAFTAREQHAASATFSSPARPDYRPPLRAAGFAIEIYEETPQWAERQVALLRAITAAEPQLYAEMDAESAGKRSGTSGTQIGHAYLKGAFSEAAVLVLRHHPAGQTYLVRVENNHGKGKALTVLAHQLARAV